MGLLKSTIFIVVVSVFLTGCQSLSSVEGQRLETYADAKKTLLPLLDIQNREFLLSAYSVQTPEQVLFLSEDQKAAFLAYFNAPGGANIPPYRRLYGYIESLYADFDYLGQTYNAQQALALKNGNCMSLALLTSALANVANVNIKYQRVNARPIYRRYDNLMTLSTHVRTYLLDDIERRANTIVVWPARIIVDYYPQAGNIPGKMIDENRFFSMYYRNLASDAMIYSDYNQAFALMYQALALSPSDSENINTMAVVLNKLGEVSHALALYKYGAELPQASLNLLSNYASLLYRQGYKVEAQAVAAQLDTAYDDNPYRWIDTAEQLITTEKYDQARSLLLRAIEAAPYLHEAYFALSKTYYLTNQIVKADKALKKASELAYLPETERLYSAKRSVLATHQHNN